MSFRELSPDGDGYLSEDVMLDIRSVIARLISLNVGLSILSLSYNRFPIFSLLMAICKSKFESIVDEERTRLYGSTTESHIFSFVRTSTPTKLFFENSDPTVLSTKSDSPPPDPPAGEKYSIKPSKESHCSA